MSCKSKNTMVEDISQASAPQQDMPHILHGDLDLFESGIGKIYLSCRKKPDTELDLRIIHMARNLPKPKRQSILSKTAVRIALISLSTAASVAIVFSVLFFLHANKAQSPKSASSPIPQLKSVHPAEQRLKIGRWDDLDMSGDIESLTLDIQIGGLELTERVPYSSETISNEIEQDELSI